MRDEKRKKRHAEIVRVTYILLNEKGYGGTSMLSIAKAAKASNETLYLWYGDKRGLFEAMARDNAAETKALLEQARGDNDAPLEALARISPVFLGMLLDDRAIALNRAAASDQTGEIGAAISAGGREVIRPLFDELFNSIHMAYVVDVKNLTEIFLGVLIGDLQSRRIIGVLPQPSSKQIDERCDVAVKLIRTLVKYEKRLKMKSPAGEGGAKGGNDEKTAWF
ncbi:MAG TPA: TetR/AcrR family transcriptional regulator [Rhodobacteraceae bacterium]|nr:TetR/AcrR family transcriptional regulator [Paracoccaceae bacterium]